LESLQARQAKRSRGDSILLLWGPFSSGDPQGKVVCPPFRQGKAAYFL
jgi:hypothetical protein